MDEPALVREWTLVAGVERQQARLQPVEMVIHRHQRACRYLQFELSADPFTERLAKTNARRPDRFVEQDEAFLTIERLKVFEQRRHDSISLSALWLCQSF
ncbi:MAG: hypothetical protein IID05_04485 [Gemmatimonadetes bacterium]|nr:hypothetical protein [Gemmatimonadota bacterium]